MCVVRRNKSKHGSVKLSKNAREIDNNTTHRRQVFSTENYVHVQCAFQVCRNTSNFLEDKFFPCLSCAPQRPGKLLNRKLIARVGRHAGGDETVAQPVAVSTRQAMKEKTWRRNRRITVKRTWCGWLESNQRPLASEANTLSTELQPRWESVAKDTVFQRLRPRKMAEKPYRQYRITL